MPAPLSQRLLSILQLTRMALVFTAISNSVCAMLLWAEFQARLSSVGYTKFVDPKRMAAIIIMSIGLYGFGMSLNDIIDRRRDQQLASHRPLPSGRIGVVTAHTICTLLFLIAWCGGAYYAWGQGRLGML
ncbi:MAG TPA: UbiA family prenyltransferase, partial [Tepidisphaeraceae bacterium]|nr:UbiA family prenyltransferase [Tepidisphaeraceae bacterium]